MAAKPKSRPRKRITTMRLQPDLMERIKTAAEEEGRSQANLVEKILRDSLAEREKEPAQTELVNQVLSRMTKKQRKTADEPNIFS